MEKQLKRVGEWEYNALRSDMARQGEKWGYLGGWEAWYREVFLIEEAWREIREDVAKSWEEGGSNSDTCDFCGAHGDITAGRWIFYCPKHRGEDWKHTYNNEVEGREDFSDVDGELGEMMISNL